MTDTPLPPPVVPVAWMYERAESGEPYGSPDTQWLDELSDTPPPPEPWIRNVRPLYTRTAIAALTAELRAVLSDAQNGLRWYQAEHPEHASEADDELHARIATALTHLTTWIQK